MSLAIFDLDNTLIADDSDHLWGEFLVSQSLVDEAEYARINTEFYNDYCRGELDIDAYLKFALSFLAEHETSQLLQWRARFLRQVIEPLVLPAARDLVESHRQRGDTLLVITATNRFVTEPIVDMFHIDHLLATEPEMKQGRYTGNYLAPPCYREGKVENLQTWLENHDCDLQQSTFYSDSHNDVPLLELVDHPIAVDPDDTLRALASEQGWPIISLRHPET